MATNYKHITIAANDLEEFRRVKLRYMNHIGESNLADGKCVIEFSKLIEESIKKKNR